MVISLLLRKPLRSAENSRNLKLNDARPISFIRRVGDRPMANNVSLNRIS